MIPNSTSLLSNMLRPEGHSMRRLIPEAVKYDVKEYWAKLEAKEIVMEIGKSHWLNRTSGLKSAWESFKRAAIRNDNLFYAHLTENMSYTTAMEEMGEDGAHKKTRFNSARTAVKDFITITTKQRTQVECLTSSSDMNPLQTAIVGRGIANDFINRSGFDKKKQLLLLKACLSGCAFGSMVWDRNAGTLQTPQDDQGIPIGLPTPQGDNCHRVHDWFDVFWQCDIEQWDEQPFVCVRVKKNRYDLMALYPEMAEEIAKVNNSNMMFYGNELLDRFSNDKNLSQDSVYLFEFYHKVSPSLPRGRCVHYLTQDVILEDFEDEQGFYNPYQTIPIYMFRLEPVDKYCLGAPYYSDLAPIQTLIDQTISTIATNQGAYGVNNILTPKGSDLNLSKVSEGLQIIEYTNPSGTDGGEPKVLRLLETPQELFNTLNVAESTMERTSRVSQTLRGSPPANVTSGQMAATISATALEFLGDAPKELAFYTEFMMNRLLKNYKLFADGTRALTIIGENETSKNIEFQKSTLEGIDKLIVRETSPLMNTQAGRMQFADGLIAQGKVSAKQYFQIVEGVPAQKIFKDELDETIAVDSEIERILKGEPVAPLLTDNHPKYILAYKAFLDNQHARINSQLTSVVLELTQQRLQLEMQLMGQPLLFQIVRQAPPPMMQPMENGQPTPSAPESNEIAAQERVSKPSKPINVG